MDRLFDLEPLPASSTTKRCGGCREHRPLSHFYPDRRYRDGVYHTCRACLRTQAKAVRGVDYALRFAQQGGVCAVCRTPPEEGQSFDVDHDHVSNRVRGLLCRRCNVAYGMLGESLDTIASLLSYHLGWQRQAGNDPALRL